MSQRNKRHWTDADLAILIGKSREGVIAEHVAPLVGRSRGACREKLKHLLSWRDECPEFLAGDLEKLRGRDGRRNARGCPAAAKRDDAPAMTSDAQRRAANILGHCEGLLLLQAAVQIAAEVRTACGDGAGRAAGGILAVARDYIGEAKATRLLRLVRDILRGEAMFNGGAITEAKAAEDPEAGDPVSAAGKRIGGSADPATDLGAKIAGIFADYGPVTATKIELGAADGAKPKT